MTIPQSVYRYAASITLAVLFLGIANPVGVAGQATNQRGMDQGERNARVCANPERGDGAAQCNARVIVDAKGAPKVNRTPSGYGPAQFRGAYGLSNLNSTQTIGIVDAYNDPNIKSDLDTYDATFGLPVFPNCSSTVTTSCFQKVDQRGGTHYPTTNSGWALEISLDVEIAHGLCPTCKLLLVEADTSSYTNLLAAVDEAVRLGANVISMSWGGNEFSSETAASFDGHFNISGVAFTTSSGDSGFGTEYPAASPYVAAVGGTTLTVSSGNTYGGETAWSGAGSGCSVYESQPAFQTALGLPGCSKRMIADVAADANPSTGAAVYDSVRYSGQTGWFKVGGTSLASPIVAAVYALAGNTATLSPANGYPYSHLASLNDIQSGSNGTCSPSYLCTAGVGYDGPTGVGTPIGTGAF